MKKIMIFLSCIALIASLNSCKNFQPITTDLIQSRKWTNEDLGRIQYYVSHDVVLQRKLSRDTGDIIKGKIILVNGEKYDQVIIKVGTKGVLTESPKPSKLNVSFELSDDHFLSFIANPQKSNRFCLAAQEWKNGIGKINYDGLTYYTDKYSENTILVVDMKKIHIQSGKTRIAKGRAVAK